MHEPSPIGLQDSEAISNLYFYGWNMYEFVESVHVSEFEIIMLSKNKFFTLVENLRVEKIKVEYSENLVIYVTSVKTITIEININSSITIKTIHIHCRNYEITRRRFQSSETIRISKQLRITSNISLCRT